VAAIEIVSPSNKDRPENRATFVAKVATLLKNNICVSIVDVVSTYDFNLYAELMTFLQSVDPALGSGPPTMYAATLRMRYEDGRRMMDNWYHPLAIGQALPTLPIWLKETWAILLDLESSYEETCRTLRIKRGERKAAWIVQSGGRRVGISFPVPPRSFVSGLRSGSRRVNLLPLPS
jgi:hypothetical protein